jgi:uncharacterized GH25 family protein
MSRTASISMMRRLRSGSLPNGLMVAAVALAGMVGPASSPAQAHDTWLLPAQARVDPGASVMLGMTSGMDFPQDESAIDADRVDRSGVRVGGSDGDFSRRDAGEHSLRLAVELPRAGVATAWIDLKPRTIDLTPGDVAHYLDEIGAPPAVLARWQAMPEPRRWRESYRKHVKTFVRVGDGAGDRSWAEPVGSALELVPEVDPTALRTGNTLNVRLLRDGAPAAGLTVAVVRAGDSTAVHRQTGADGRASFPLEREGWYLVRSTDVRPATAKDLDWESDFATLTLEVTGAASDETTRRP